MGEGKERVKVRQDSSGSDQISACQAALNANKIY